MSRKDIPDVLWESCDIVTELWKNPYWNSTEKVRPLNTNA
jgi:hypothetical protein